ncbi:MAG: hypothetical protein HYU66_00640, partial [Armatimonadetes bacterium]|nr:hypothetical protein [Armatimonadota bacterium]
ERKMVMPARPDWLPSSVDSLIGSLEDEFHYVYNPDNDILSVRLVSSLGDCVVARDGEPGFQTMVAEATGEQVGIIVRDYRRRFDAANLGQPVSREEIERAVEQLADQLPRAA